MEPPDPQGARCPGAGHRFTRFRRSWFSGLCITDKYLWRIQRRDHKRTVPSMEPEARVCPSGESFRATMASVCPFRD